MLFIFAHFKLLFILCKSNDYIIFFNTLEE